MKVMDLEIDLTGENVADTLTKAIEKINKLQTNTEEMLDKMCSDLLDDGVKMAKEQLRSFGVKDGNLSNSIKHTEYSKETHSGVITAGEGLLAGVISGGKEGKVSKYPLMSYATFVEWGTGSKGRKAQKEKEKKLAVYSPSQELKGIRKKEEPVDDEKWVYFDEQKNHFYTTSGQPPKPFMHNTKLYLVIRAKNRIPGYIETYLFRK